MICSLLTAGMRWGGRRGGWRRGGRRGRGWRGRWGRDGGGRRGKQWGERRWQRGLWRRWHRGLIAYDIYRPLLQLWPFCTSSPTHAWSTLTLPPEWTPSHTEICVSSPAHTLSFSTAPPHLLTVTWILSPCRNSLSVCKLRVWTLVVYFLPLHVVAHVVWDETVSAKCS